MQGANPVDDLADAQQQRLLERPPAAADKPVAYAELHARGIDFAAAGGNKLELNGCAIESVMTTGG